MKNLLKAVILILDEVILVIIAFVVLSWIGVHLSSLVIATVVIVLAVAILVVYKVIGSLNKIGQVGGREGLIGLHGKVVKPLTPEGIIKVHGELWKAKCINNDSISSQGEVTVIDVEGLMLLVTRRKET